MLVSVILAGLLAGCGEDPKVSYQRDLRSVGSHVATSLARIPTDDDQTIAPQQIAKLADQLRSSADSLSSLNPPDDTTKRAQKMFVRGLRGVATALTGLSRHLAKSPDAATQAERFVEFATDDSIQRSFDDLENAQDAYARAGFRVFKDPNGVVTAPHVGAPARSTTKLPAKPTATSAKASPTTAG